MSDGRFLQADKPQRRGAVLLIHSWWGLTRSFRDYGGALTKSGHDVALADLYGGRSARSAAEARALRRAPRKLPMYRALEADLARLAERSAVDQVAVIGFSMGAHWAVWLAQQPHLPVRAAVLYYGVRAGNFGACQARFLAHFAQDDPWVRPAARKRMEKALAAAGRPYRAFDYPGTGHWFAESAEPAHAPQAADLALARTLDFLGAE